MILSVLIVSGIILALFGVGYFLVFHNPDPYVTKPAPGLPEPPLKELAERQNVQIGSFASLKYLRERAYRELLASQFEYAIIDGEPNWRFEDFSLRPSKDEFDFNHLDQVFEFADSYDLPVRYQHLLWGDEKWLPEWLTKGNYTNQELLDIIKKHVDTVMQRYKGRVREYTVVNEAFSRELKFGGNEDWWGKKLDYDYIDKAFMWAKENDPEAILILNDFGNEREGDIYRLMYDYIKSAKARGIPIDAVGMQMHIRASDAPSSEDVVKAMNGFASLGVKVYITEFDVDVHDLAGSEEDKEQRQAVVYADMLKACLDVGRDICPNFGYLGLIDRQSWYNGLGVEGANPLLFNNDYTPKPAFFAIREALESDK